MVLGLEYFSGKQDVLSVETSFNLPQVYAIILIMWSAYQLYKVFQEAESQTPQTQHAQE